MKRTATTLTLISLTLLASGCQSMSRPKHTGIQDQLDMAANNQLVTPVIIQKPSKPAAGSLWQPGSKHFFKDSRAGSVGDILTVLVSESTDAETEAKTETTRDHNQGAGITNVLRSTASFLKSPAALAGAAATDNLINTDSERAFTGEGKTERTDTLTGTVAAVVTQILPNGYLVIQGKREVVVNYELQELNIQGIVRPEDISAANTIESSKIAEARIFYAGRGIVDETQTPSYGVRFLDKVMPF